jgi:hypothetical protein
MFTEFDVVVAHFGIGNHCVSAAAENCEASQGGQPVLTARAKY